MIEVFLTYCTVKFLYFVSFDDHDKVLQPQNEIVICYYELWRQLTFSWHYDIFTVTVNEENV